MIRSYLFLSDAYGINGGIAKYGLDVIAGLANENIELNILARNCAKNYEKQEKINVKSFASKGKFGYIVETIISAFSKKDLVICGHINLLPFAFVSAVFGRSPLILFVYGIDTWYPHKNFIINYLIRRIKYIISISKFTEMKLRAWQPKLTAKIFILPNGIDLSIYGIGKKPNELIEKYKLDKKIILMTMGRLSSSEKYKGIDEILEVFPNLLKKNSNLIYLICGDGDDKFRLAKKANDLGLRESVVFTGYIPEKEKKKYYDLSDLYVMPSYGEGFGFVFLEAMACGIPVLASIKDGGYEAIRCGDLGRAVDPHDLSKIETVILEMLHNNKKKIPDGLEVFSIVRFNLELKKIIMSVLH